LFGPLKQHLGQCTFHSNKEVEMTVHEWLQMQGPGFYHKKNFKFTPRWDKRINVLGDDSEK
jgi:hypothetical protein